MVTKQKSASAKAATVASAASTVIAAPQGVAAPVPAVHGTRKQTPADLAHTYPTVALVLQGGGALGAYQCGVYEALHDAGLRPNWFVGTSIGAINAAILAGNAPEHRVEKLHEFWDTICEPAGGASSVAAGVRALLAWYPNSDRMSAWANSLGAMGAIACGQQGFFEPRHMSPFMYQDGSPEATSFYDTSPLKSTLERLVDFDRINSHTGPRLAVGAVCVENANVRYFDSANEKLRAEHIMASGALPPGFPSIEIDGRHFWDGGLVSNTPLERVAAELAGHDTLALQVDLWSAHGSVPRSMMDVLERQKDIQYSSRTRRGTDSEGDLLRLRYAIGELVSKVPAGSLNPELQKALDPWLCDAVFNVIHLIYQSKEGEAQYKDYAFGLGTQREHWASGVADMQQTLEHPDFFVKPSRRTAMATHDVHRIVAARRHHATSV